MKTLLFVINYLFNKIKIQFIIIRYKYWIYKDKEITSFLSKIKIIKDVDTIDYIVKNKSSCCRFGDGEFLVMGGRENGFQNKNQVLASKLKHIFLNPCSTLLVCLPSFIKNVNTLTTNSQLSALGFTYRYLKDSVLPYIHTDYVYGDSLFTRFYMNKKNKSKVKYYIEKLKTIWNDNDLLIVEGKHSRLGVGNNLFDNSISIKRILCPDENAFDKYDSILQSVINNCNGRLVILALGMTATVLAYDLANIGIRALDLGHIDIEYEWFLMKARTKVPVKNKQMHEVSNGICNSDLYDASYLNQIIIDLS